MKRLLAFLLSVVMLAGSAFALASCGDDSFDFKKKDLTKYVEVQQALYRGITIRIDPLDEVTDETVEEQIRSLVVAAGQTEVLTDVAVQKGDQVELYYRGCLYDEESGVWYDLGIVAYDTADYGSSAGGKKTTYYSPVSNFDPSSSATTITVGKGQFIESLENALIGIIPSATRLKHTTAGYVGLLQNADKTYSARALSALYVSVDCYDEAGNSVLSLSNARVPREGNEILPAEVLAHVIGTPENGLKNAFNTIIGEESLKISEDVTLDRGFFVTHDRNGDGTPERLFYQISVSSTVDERSQLCEVTFPDGYDDIVMTESSYTDSYGYNHKNGVLYADPRAITTGENGEKKIVLTDRRAAFYVVIGKITRAKALTAEVVDAVYSHMGVTIPEVSGDEAKAQALRTYVRDTLEAAREEQRKSVAERAFWETIRTAAPFKELPKSLLDQNVTALRAQAESMYQYYSQYNKFEDIDDFAAKYFGYDTEKYEGVDAYIREQAEITVHEQLIFYSIVKAENLWIPESEQEQALSDIVDKYVEQTGQRPAQIIEAYGRDNLMEQALYERLFTYLWANNTIVEAAAEE